MSQLQFYFIAPLGQESVHTETDMQGLCKNTFQGKPYQAMNNQPSYSTLRLRTDQGNTNTF
jgi:hypothetical protein